MRIEPILIEDLVENGALAKPMDGNHGAIHPKSADFIGYGAPRFLTVFAATA
jgi:type I restriction enzyme S subunit